MNPSPLLILFLCFTLLPLVELSLLLMIAQFSGHWWVSLLLVICTGFLGASLIRRQGSATFRGVRADLAAGRMPTETLLDGLMIFAAGLLMITPGVLTDMFAVTLLIPACRRWYRTILKAWFAKRFKIQTFGFGSGAAQGWQTSSDGDVVDSYVVPNSSDDPKLNS